MVKTPFGQGRQPVYVILIALSNTFVYVFLCNYVRLLYELCETGSDIIYGWVDLLEGEVTLGIYVCCVRVCFCVCVYSLVH